VIQLLTEESIKRLYRVNDFRDFFISHTVYLNAIGALKIDAFGSFVKGVSKESADIDIIFYLKGALNINLNEHRVQSSFSDLVLPLMQKLGLSLNQSDYNLGDDIHVHVVFIENETQEAGFARNGLTIWKTSAEG